MPNNRTTLQDLVNNIKTCAECVFATTMFGKPEHINFDHDIVYYIPPPNDCFRGQSMFYGPDEICDANHEHWNGYQCEYPMYSTAWEIRDLLNIDYPTSVIENVNENIHVYKFHLTAARLIDEQNDNDLDEKKFSDLEEKMWRIIECMSTCTQLVQDGVVVTRDKGTFNDKLITVDFTFDVSVFSYCIDPPC